MHTELTKGGPTKNGPVECTPDCTKVLQQMRALISRETILGYPDLKKNIHTGALDVQLDAVII